MTIIERAWLATGGFVVEAAKPDQAEWTKKEVLSCVLVFHPGQAFLISRSVDGPGCQGLRVSERKQKQKTGAREGARASKNFLPQCPCRD